MVEIALDDAIADELERKAGVRVSSQWLSACLAHLRETNQHVTADAVLHQILHSDLRDVVQRDNDDGVLRQALSQDKAKVPESFILMVQVEELLDVSLNAEARLQVGPASATAPTPVGNQRLRCLKLYLSDGYKQTTQHIVAMEILPLQDLSVNSKAGIKVILRGSTTLTCRHGILMCSPGNAQVLGGCVSSLMEIQRKALEQAKKVAGVGVDPTVKALIWNPLGAEEEGGEQDEGEHESRDVDAAPPPLAAATRNVRPPPVPPPDARPLAAAAVHRHPPPPFQQPRQQPQPPAPPNFPGSNPYASSRIVSSSTSSRPASASAATRAVVDLSVDNEPVAEPQIMDLITPTNNSTVTDPSSAASRTFLSQDSTSLSQDTGVSHMDTEPLSFAELFDLVVKLQTDQQVYRQYESKVFVVPCKMIGHHQYFNIDKKKKKKRDRKNKDNKYEYSYVMTVNAGTSDGDGTILCSVASDILTSHFEMEASEMRDLQKTQPEKCTQIVQEKGLKIKATLVSLASWHLRLEQPAADLFDGTARDGNKPILQLIHLA